MASRSSDVYIHVWSNAHNFGQEVNAHKSCAHKKGIAFIQFSQQNLIFNEFWRTARNNNAHTKIVHFLFVGRVSLYV